MNISNTHECRNGQKNNENKVPPLQKLKKKKIMTESSSWHARWFTQFLMQYSKYFKLKYLDKDNHY